MGQPDRAAALRGAKAPVSTTPDGNMVPEEVTAIQVSANFGYLAIAYETGGVTLLKLPRVIDPIVKDENGALYIELDLETRWAAVFEYDEAELRLADWKLELLQISVTSRLRHLIARHQIPYSKPFLYFNVQQRVLQTPVVDMKALYFPNRMTEKPSPFIDMPRTPAFSTRNLQKHMIISSISYAPLGGQSKCLYQFSLADISGKFLQNGSFLHSFDVDACNFALEKNREALEKKQKAEMRLSGRDGSRKRGDSRRSLKEILEIINQQKQQLGQESQLKPEEKKPATSGGASRATERRSSTMGKEAYSSNVSNQKSDASKIGKDDGSDVNRLGKSYLSSLLDTDPRVLHFPQVMTSAEV